MTKIFSIEFVGIRLNKPWMSVVNNGLLWSFETIEYKNESKNWTEQVEIIDINKSSNGELENQEIKSTETTEFGSE